jgi:prophage DNA circulation protein
MSDAAIATIVAGLVAIATLYFKLREMALKLKDVAKQTEAVSLKTDAVVEKADTINDKADVAAQKAATAAQKASVATTAALTTAGKVQALDAKIDTNTELTASVSRAIDGHDGGPSMLEQINEFSHQAMNHLLTIVEGLTRGQEALTAKLNEVLVELRHRPPA